MNRRPEVRRALVAALLVPLLIAPSAPAAAQLAATEYEGAAALGLVLRQLGTTKRVLMIAAHPDDEQTQLLSSLALGHGADVAYLSLTRGEGGQNGIGPELQEALGLLRTGELLAARRLDGALQFFTRAVDWGFSKNAEEAFRMWPREEVLRDVVAVVRYFRPDVILSVFSGTPRDGHGQHQVAGVVAQLAFDAAADSGRFPEQISAGLRPHAPVHLYQLVRGGTEVPVARIATGRLDPLLGLSHFQIAMASRSRHRSQDMGRLLTPGPQSTALALGGTRKEAPTFESVFTGVDTTLAAIASAALRTGPVAGAGSLIDLLARYETTVEEVRSTFNPFAPERIVRSLAEAAGILDASLGLAESRGDAARDLRFHLEIQRARAAEAVRRAARVRIDALTAAETLVPGEAFDLELQVWNGGSDPIEVETLEPRLPSGWTAVPQEPLARRLEAGAMTRRRFEVTVPTTAPPTEAYFLRLPRQEALYVWPTEAGPVGFPFEPDLVAGRAVLSIAGVGVETETPATFQGLDPRSGEFRRPLRVVPAVSVTVEPGLSVLPIARRHDPLPVSVRLRAAEPDGLAGTLRLDAPAGWRIEPAAVPIRFDLPGEERVIEFTAHAPDALQAGRATFTAIVEDQIGRRFDRGYTLIDYPHIRPTPQYRAATLDVVAVDVAVPAALRVGYIAAAGDNVPGALAQLGVDVELLGPTELPVVRLDHDVIVVGIRAYEGRPDLIAHNQRLLDYVRAGGTMIVQYNQYGYTAPGLAPYPISMARPHDRVTDHEASVRILDPTHPILTTPNRITDADFEGWVQERGLYFLDGWDDRYLPLLEMADPGEAPNRGSLLVARHGDGTYVYTGLALFRQLPAGVPGAYRLFANLLALGAP